MKLKEVGIVTGVIPMIDIWKLLLMIGGITFLSQFGEVSKESLRFNTCVDLLSKSDQFDQFIGTRNDQERLSAAVIRCNGGSFGDDSKSIRPINSTKFLLPPSR